MDAALEADPPVVVWEKNSHGVWIGVEVYDPHPDGGHNGTKTSCKRNHPYTEENTMITPAGWRQCRICKNEGRRAA